MTFHPAQLGAALGAGCLAVSAFSGELADPARALGVLAVIVAVAFLDRTFSARGE